MLSNINNHLSVYEFDPMRIKVVVVAHGAGLKFFLSDLAGTPWPSQAAGVAGRSSFSTPCWRLCVSPRSPYAAEDRCGLHKPSRQNWHCPREDDDPSSHEREAHDFLDGADVRPEAAEPAQNRAVNSATMRNGTPRPAAYAVSRPAPAATLSPAPAMMSTDASTGPRQGLHPNAKASPTTKAPKTVLGFRATWIRASASGIARGTRPACAIRGER